jgi:hypothetical protein
MLALLCPRRYYLSSMAAAAEPRPVLSQAANLQALPSSAREFDLLVACCADPTAGHADRIRQILSGPLDWKRLLALVDHHRVVPQVYGALSAFAHLIPAQLLDALRSRYQDNARKALWFTAELVRILHHLESAGIKALPYKGPVLAETLYGEVTQRQFGDLDILILPEDVPKAKAALLALGYKPRLNLAPSLETSYIESGYEYSFSAAQGPNLLELQWRIVPRFYCMDLEVADLFARAECLENSREAAPEHSSRRNNLLKNPRFVSGHRFSDAVAATESVAPSGAEVTSRVFQQTGQPWVESETPPSPSGAKDQARCSLPRTLRPEDLLLALCVHAAKHVWVQLSWLCDIAQLVKSRQLDWNAIQDEAHRLGIERIVNLNLLLAHKLLGSALPPTIQKRVQEDPSTTILAAEIFRIIEASVHYDTESIPYFRLMMRLRERWQDQARFLWRLASTPSVSEWSAVPLPRPLQPLYRLVRLSRLTKRLVSAG